MFRRLMFLGAPLSGKGTQSTRISEEFGIPYLSSGGLFRDAIAAANELGKLVENTINSGALVSDDITNAVVEQGLAKIDFSKGFILDGYPRNLAQAQELEKMLAKRGEKLDRVIYIEVQDEVLINRQRARLTCATCGATYNDTNLRPKVEGVCDKCGGTSLVRRKDDNEEAIKNRLASYHKATSPLLDFYQKQNILVKVDGDVDAKMVQKSIIGAIN